MKRPNLVVPFSERVYTQIGSVFVYILLKVKVLKKGLIDIVKHDL